jgi:hypothetical protein
MSVSIENDCVTAATVAGSTTCSVLPNHGSQATSIMPILSEVGSWTSFVAYSNDLVYIGCTNPVLVAQFARVTI